MPNYASWYEVDEVYYFSIKHNGTTSGSCPDYLALMDTFARYGVTPDNSECVSVPRKHVLEALSRKFPTLSRAIRARAYEDSHDGGEEEVDITAIAMLDEFLSAANKDFENLNKGKPCT